VDDGVRLLLVDGPADGREIGDVEDQIVLTDARA